jgi:hypothetical protein
VKRNLDRRQPTADQSHEATIEHRDATIEHCDATIGRRGALQPVGAKQLPCTTT